MTQAPPCRRADTSLLRALALAALRRYDLRPTSVRLVDVAANATFRVVDEDGSVRALRISLPGPIDHTELETRSELAWLHDLAGHPHVRVASPVPARDGEVLTMLRDPRPAHREVPPELAPRRCVLFGWLPGRLLAGTDGSRAWFALGTLAAQLHAAAEAFRPPAWFAVPRYDRPLPFDEPVVLFDDGPHRAAERRERFRRAADAVAQAIALRAASGEPPRILHGDLHQWNVRVHEGRAGAFDFEDLVWGWPVQDVAISLYYTRRSRHPGTAWAAFRAGYEAVAPWPARGDAELATFVMGRGLVIANTALHLDLPEPEVAAVLARVDQLAHDVLGR